MKLIKIIFLLIISSKYGFSQNNATDFTALDCDGVSHHLFSELDSGKVIVIAWVIRVDMGQLPWMHIQPPWAYNLNLEE